MTPLELPLTRRVERVDVPLDVALRPRSFRAAIVLCAQLSGLEPKEIYGPLEIDAGHWTRICNGDAHFPTDKLIDFMDLCGNEVPLIWLANARGKGLVLLKSEAERRADELQVELHEAHQRNALLMEIMNGRR